MTHKADGPDGSALSEGLGPLPGTDYAPDATLCHSADQMLAYARAEVVRAVAAERERWKQAVEPVFNASEGELPHALYVLAGFARA